MTNSYNVDLDSLAADATWLVISKMKECGQVHVIPRYGKSHDLTHQCWCGPSDEVRPDGNVIIIHNMEN